MCKCNPDNPEKSCDNCRGGRPSKYKDLDLKQVAELVKLGWTDLRMRRFFGVANSTWYKWKIDHPEFSESLKKWKDYADDNVEKSLYERACGYSHPDEKVLASGEKIKTIKHYPPDTKAAEFWLRVRKPEIYNIKNGIEVSGPNGKPIETESAVKIYIPDNGRDDS